MTNRHIFGWFALVNLLAVGGLFAQTVVVLPDCRVASIQKPYSDGDFRLTLRCEKSGTQTPITGDKGQVLRVVQPPPPAAVNCAGTWSAWTGGAWSACNLGTQTRLETRVFTVTTPASNGGLACPASPETRTGSQSCTVTPPPPPAGVIRGIVNEAPDIHGKTVFGTCTKAFHDTFVVTGLDGLKYRTWHAQNQPIANCVFGHEHGANPGPAITELGAAANALAIPAADKAGLVASLTGPVAFGYIGLSHVESGFPNGMEEPHEGFKVFVVYHQEANDEGRNSEMSALNVTHFGTGSVGRQRQPDHSVESRQIHRPSGVYQSTKALYDTGVADMVCAPRISPSRDFITILTSRCGIDSAYEIWNMFKALAGGQLFATPAVFDPITVRNASNDAEVVYAWDPRVLVTRNHDGDDWSGFRGCDHESYAQPPTLDRVGMPASFWADAMGNVVPAGTPRAILQWLSPVKADQLRGSTRTTQEIANNQPANHAFKKRRGDNCGFRSALSLKN